MCKMHSMVSYFYYRCILQHFAKSINILYGTNALLAAFIFKAFSYRFANRFHWLFHWASPLAPLGGSWGDPGNS